MLPGYDINAMRRAAKLDQIKSKIESTGGKSDYYKIHLPEKVAKRVADQGYIEIEDLMKYGFGNDFDYSTALKSLKRMYEDQHGKGKAGSDIQYNKNKVDYSTNKIMQDLEENS